MVCKVLATLPWSSSAHGMFQRLMCLPYKMGKLHVWFLKEGLHCSRRIEAWMTVIEFLTAIDILMTILMLAARCSLSTRWG